MSATVHALDTGGDVFLDAYLQPLRRWLEREEVTEILVNTPGEIWVEAGHAAMERHAVPELDERHIRRLAEQIARISHQGINREQPLLGATLPDGARVQFVAPSATRGSWAVAIRRHRLVDVPLDAYASAALVAARCRDHRRQECPTRSASCVRRSGGGARSW